jgi:rare lipoprotein A
MPRIPPKPKRIAVLLLVIATVSCTTAARRARDDVDPGYTEKGIASWYGPGFHGKRTANGEVYDMNALTAAHRTLAFGSLVEVHNLDNGRSVKVRIIDRGPFIRGRIIDLSRAAAEKIGMIGTGTAQVRIRVVGAAPEVDSGSYRVQVGAFQELINARELVAELEADFFDARVRSDGDWHRVELGPFDSRREAEEQVRALQRAGYKAILKK